MAFPYKELKKLALARKLPAPLTYALMGQGGGTPGPAPDPGVETTVTGVSPLLLAAALGKPLVSLTQYGLCTQDGTPTPAAPVDIVCNNGVVRYGALGANLLDPSAANTVLGYYVNKADGAVKDSTYNFMFAAYMPVEAGKTYVAYGRAKNGNDLSDYNRVAWYDSTKTWIEGANYTQNQIAVVTAPNNAAYARFSCNPSGGTSVAVTQAIVDSYNWTFAEGTAEITPFVPFVGGIYVDGTPEVLSVTASGADTQTATAPDLFAVGDYADEVDIISGAVKRKVGVWVLTGEESWTVASTNSDVYYLSSANLPDDYGIAARFTPICSHLEGVMSTVSISAMTANTIKTNNSSKIVYACVGATYTTKEAWKAFVAEQYAAGTPIIILYPLAEETTESVTPQALSTAEGDNVVSVTAMVSGNELEAVYMKQSAA